MERVDRFLYDVGVNVLANLIAGGIGALFLLLLGVLPRTPGLIAGSVAVVVGGLSLLVVIYGVGRVAFASEEEVRDRGKGWLLVLGAVTMAAGVTALVSALLNLSWPTSLLGVASALPVLLGGGLLVLACNDSAWQRFHYWTMRRTVRRKLRSQGIGVPDEVLEIALEIAVTDGRLAASSERAGPT